LGRGLTAAYPAKGNKFIIGTRRKALLDEVAKPDQGMDKIELDLHDPAQRQRVSAAARRG